MEAKITIRPLHSTDVEEWLRMRQLLFKDCSEEEHQHDLHQFLRKAPEGELP